MAEPEAIPVTEAMIDAALHAHATGEPWESPFGQGGSFAAIYRAMAAAAPEPTPVPAGVASEAVERMTDDANHPFGCYAGEPDNTLCLVRIDDVRLAAARDKAMGEEIERLRAETADLAGAIDDWEDLADDRDRCIKALEAEIAALVAWQGNPVLEATIEAQGKRIVALEEALTGVTEDLTAEIDARYVGLRDHPSMKRRYDRDMEPVIRARALTAKEDTDHG